MKCNFCSNEVPAGASICPSCGNPINAGTQQQIQMSRKSRTSYALLGFFLGNLGVHDFYLGRVGRGIFNIIGNFLISPFLVQVSTGIELLTTQKDKKGNVLQGDSTLPVILGVLLIILNLILAVIVGCIIFAGIACSSL